MAGLVLAIHVLLKKGTKTWMPAQASLRSLRKLGCKRGHDAERMCQTKGAPMAKLESLLEEIVTANRILAHEGVVDSFGHVSARHPDNPKRFLLSRARAPERIEKDDIMEFTLEGDPVNARDRAPYLERFIHGGIYEARPDVHSVVHNHSPSVIPFGITERKLKPLLHMCANIGHEVPTW